MPTFQTFKGNKNCFEIEGKITAIKSYQEAQKLRVWEIDILL